MIGILLVVVGLCLIFGLPKAAKSLGRIVLGLVVLVTALPLTLSYCSSTAHEGASAIGTVDLPWGWMFFGFFVIITLIAYFRFQGHRKKLDNFFISKPTSPKRRVDR